MGALEDSSKAAFPDLFESSVWS